ncbi:hypothetical protein TDB9533_04757 [Thalassocella blandensis]|nr:hypothetical protein TDB9533_04757 [Thalassocella blandensis]
MVNRGPAGVRKDPALKGFTDDVFEADHIVPMKRITQMYGFATLSEANQIAVLNFIGLVKSSNASKGAKDWFEWKMHKKSGTPVDPRFAKKMQRKQLKVECQLQQEINRLQ